MSNAFRKLATIRRISEIKPIENADRLELAVIDGWQVVVNKGEYTAGSTVVFCEIDSWIPHELAPFLSKGKEPREFNGVKGERLRTVKLRGVLSQGLVLPVSVLLHGGGEGDDVTEVLGIQKWEKPIPASLRGQVKGNFPAAIPKTDQERIQNLVNKFDELKKRHVWFVSEKLHGSSCTFYLDQNGEFHVCSRNLDLKEEETNAYWKAARKFDIEAKMRQQNLLGFAIQGELLGQGINGNNYGVELEFKAFDLYNENTGYCNPYEFTEAMTKMQIDTVPFEPTLVQLSEDMTVQRLLELADGPSKLADVPREGFVFVSAREPWVSFKVVSNAWLQRYE